MRLLFPYILKVFFVFTFVSCTLFTLDDQMFQSEEEEFHALKRKSKASSSDSSLNVEDGDVLKDIFSDSSSDSTLEYEIPESSSLLSSSSSSKKTPKKKKKKWLPLKKIPSNPWKHDGKWINAVYIARPADNINHISNIIFSEDKTNELKSINPLLKRREAKVGDKIYYSSPLRPNDRNNFYHYYEDTSQIAQTYDLNSGDNIRVVSERLLGHKDSWKEIWATNPQVQSKGVISEPVTIQYWSTASPTPPPAAPVVVEEPPAPPVVEEEVMVAENTVIENDQPISDPMEDENFPPLEDPALSNNQSAAMDELPWYKKNMKIIGAGVLLAIMAILLIRIIRDRRNRSDFDFSQTHIDIDSLEE